MGRPTLRSGAPESSPPAEPMEHYQGDHQAGQPTSLAIRTLRSGLPALGLALAACAAPSDALESAAVSSSGGKVEVTDAVYSLGVDRSGQVSGSLAVEILEPGAPSASLSASSRRLSPKELTFHQGQPWLPRVLDPASVARISAEVSARGEVHRWRAPRAFPLQAVDPRDVALGLVLDEPVGAAARASFTLFAERLLLHRDPLAGQPLAGAVARAWFGLLVAPKAGEDRPVVTTLADVLFALYEEEDAEGASELRDGGWYRPSADAEWATPRWLLLRDRIGSSEFTNGLRQVVDAGAAGEAQGFEEVAEAFGDQGASFIRCWLLGPAGPLVETSWREDSERGRLLLRVDQLQRVTATGAPAYPFTLPVTIKTEGGELLQRTLEVSRRKQVFQLPIEGLPSAVEFDPQGTLEAFVKIRGARDS